MPPLTPPPHPCVVTILQPLAVPRRRHRYAARCRAVRERACALVAFATLATSRCHRRLCHPCHCISPGTARAICTVVTEPRRHSPSALFRVVSHGVLSAAVLSRERQGKGRRAVGRLQRGAEDLRSRAHPPGTETRKSMPRAGREACTPGRKTRGLVRKDTRCNDQRTEERGTGLGQISFCGESGFRSQYLPRTPIREGILRNTVRAR